MGVFSSLLAQHPCGLLPPLLYALMLLCCLSGFNRTQHHPAHSAQVAPAHSDTLLRHVQARHAVTSPIGERSRAWGIIVPTLHSEKSLIRAALDKSGLVAAAGQVRALHDAALRMGAQERGGEHRGASCFVGVHAGMRLAARPRCLS